MLPIVYQLPDPSTPAFIFKLSQILTDISKEVNKNSGATWNGVHPILGQYHLWVDATGDLRIKSSTPTTDLDGQIVGTQS